MKPKIAISIGDLNGIGIEIALSSHIEISKLCKPIYCIDQKMLKQASELLNIPIPDNIDTVPLNKNFKIKPQKISKKSGSYSFLSFKTAVNLAKSSKADAVLTLPIHKKAWEKAGINYVGHTDALRDIFKKNAIMMLGVPELYVALFTEHIPLKDVAKHINKNNLSRFLITLYNSFPQEHFGVLGLNPHAGDNGVLGDEELEISKAIKKANKKLKKDIFYGPLVPDTAFTIRARKTNTRIIAMYHDQGLAPLKALHFDDGINVSLNLPIIRTSVDHGTAFDIAYKNKKPSNKSYINAIKMAIKLI